MTAIRLAFGLFGKFGGKENLNFNFMEAETMDSLKDTQLIFVIWIIILFLSHLSFLGGAIGSMGDTGKTDRDGRKETFEMSFRILCFPFYFILKRILDLPNEIHFGNYIIMLIISFFNSFFIYLSIVYFIPAFLEKVELLLS